MQLNQDKIDGINAKLLELIDTQLAAARSQLESAEAQITAGRKEYEKQLKNFGNTVSNSVMSQMSTEVGAAVETVRAQAQALLESVNSLIAVVKEPELQQARGARRSAEGHGQVQRDRYARYRLSDRYCG